MAGSQAVPGGHLPLDFQEGPKELTCRDRVSLPHPLQTTSALGEGPSQPPLEGLVSVGSDPSSLGPEPDPSLHLLQVHAALLARGGAAWGPSWH